MLLPLVQRQRLVVVQEGVQGKALDGVLGALDDLTPNARFREDGEQVGPRIDLA